MKTMECCHMKMLIRCATGNVMLGSHRRFLPIDSESHQQKQKVNRHLSTETIVGKLSVRCACWMKHEKGHA